MNAFVVLNMILTVLTLLATAGSMYFSTHTVRSLAQQQTRKDTQLSQTLCISFKTEGKKRQSQLFQETCTLLGGRLRKIPSKVQKLVWETRISGHEVFKPKVDNLQAEAEEYVQSQLMIFIYDHLTYPQLINLHNLWSSKGVVKLRTRCKLRREVWSIIRPQGQLNFLVRYYMISTDKSGGGPLMIMVPTFHYLK